MTTYQNRQDVDKYAHVASPAEIKENDYNLNIPRYVDTFEAEAAIDLSAVAAALRQVKNDSAAVDAQIADFCSELGIENPFAEGSK